MEELVIESTIDMEVDEMDENNMKAVRCPECGSGKVSLLDTYRTAGTVVGGGVGFAAGLAAAKKGSEMGALAGARIGKLIPVVGPIGGGVVGGLGGAIAGMLTGAAVGNAAGDCVDRLIVREWECENCGATFKTDSIGESGGETSEGG